MKKIPKLQLPKKNQITTMNKSETKVLRALEKIGSFASAQELYKFMSRNRDSIGLTTVYRAVQSLVDKNVIDQLRRDDGEAIYRLCGERHHHHLVCKSCGSTVEIEGSAIEKWSAEIAKKHGFREVGHTAEIYGLCRKC